MLHQHGFRHHGTRAAGTGYPGDRRQQMQKKDGQISAAVSASVESGLLGVRGGRAWSGGVPFVPMMQAADLRDRHNAALDRPSDRPRNRRILVQ